MKKIIISLSFFFLISCANAHKLGLISLGMTKQEVIKSLGRPNSISAQKSVEYLHYNFYDTYEHAFYGITKEYYVRIIDGKVESFGKIGDFDSSKESVLNIKTEENINLKINKNK